LLVLLLARFDRLQPLRPLLFARFCFRLCFCLGLCIAVVLLLVLLFVFISFNLSAFGFKALALAETGGPHGPFVNQAKVWLNNLGSKSGFSVDYIEDGSSISDDFLSNYKLFIHLNYPPWDWGNNDTSMPAFENAMDAGTIGYVGFHHASLLGDLDEFGYPLWQWFYHFMGDILWTDYIATFADATVDVEISSHPVMKGVPTKFNIAQEEWYTWDRSNRPNVTVIAHVDESTYKPDSKVKMGDHPVIWSNEKIKARNVYIFMGHHPELFNNAAFTTMFTNAIFWAVAQ